MTDPTPPGDTEPALLTGNRFAVRAEILFWEGVVEFLQRMIKADPAATVEQAVAAALMEWKDVRDELDGMDIRQRGYEELARQLTERSDVPARLREVVRTHTQVSDAPQPYSTGAQDPHWIDTDETIVVVTNPMDAVVYQRFLRSRGLCLERIHGATVDAGPMYGIASRG
jgi:hypothetical protein